MASTNLGAWSSSTRLKEDSGDDPQHETTRGASVVRYNLQRALPMSNPYTTTIVNFAGNSYTRDQAWPTPPFHGTQHFYKLEAEGPTEIHPIIRAEFTKGFFLSNDHEWTCYRRNYFAVECSYVLVPDDSYGQLYVYHHENEAELPTRKSIKGIAMSLRAEVDGEGGKPIELIQHTPNRDRGPPQMPITPVPLRSITTEHVWGTPSPNTAGFGSTAHSFERIQFKSATANNGKRRAQQQYYTVIVELLCDIRQEVRSSPVWLTVAHRRSYPLVVRGRSPSHYQNTGPHNPIPGPSALNLQGSAGGIYGAHAPLESDQHTSPYHVVSKVSRPLSPFSAYVHLEQPTEPYRPPKPISIDLFKDGSREQDILDDSSVSSHHSQVNGSTRPLTLSSMTSATDDRSTAGQFVALIFDFNGVRDLLAACFAMNQDDRAERNVRRLLKLLAVKLRSESSQQVEVTIARILKRQSRQIARVLRDESRSVSSTKARLPLDTVPASPSYMIEQFLADQDAKPAEKEDTSAASGVQGGELTANLGHPSALEKGMRQPFGIDDYNTQKGSATTRFRNTPSSTTPMTIQKANDTDLSSDSSDANSDIHFSKDVEETNNFLLTKGKDFLRNSEALEDFREGLLDFRIGMENALRNKKMEDRTSFTGIRLQSYSQYFYQSGMIWWRSFAHLRKKLRPSVRPGMRRMQWVCDCGEDLYADFENDDPIAFNKLHAALSASSTSTISMNTAAALPQSSTGIGTAEASVPCSSASSLQQRYRQSSSANFPAPAPRAASAVVSDAHEPRYLAVCSSAGGIYKSLSELDVTLIKSDFQLFKSVAAIYQNLSSWRSLWKIFLKPVSVEFVQLSVWDIRNGYVSISDRPACVPPKDEADYDFSPRPLAPLPPVPPEIFVHYLGHHVDINSPTPDRFVWTPRLPTRRMKRLIDCDVPTYGWGIFIKEGPNKFFVFWMVILSVVCSVLLSVLWATLKGDVQGASGLGSLVLGVHSVIMAVFMFRFGDLR